LTLDRERDRGRLQNVGDVVRDHCWVVGIKDGVYLIHEQMIRHLLAGILTFQVVASHKG
jgi:hypothetical protein